MNDPFALFASWYESSKAEALVNPDIVALATATPHGHPSVRMVFYRGIREGGFSFFTNYESRKGRELAGNPFAAMVFYWPHIGRQLRIEGSVEKLSAAESDAYFRSRPFFSQVTAAISLQSRAMLDEAAFLAELGVAGESGGVQSVARPDDWGGFALVPASFEFWIRGEHRRHQRTVYERAGDIWESRRLFP
jgi:pyridoxamine 5'-phosphate oxidase